MAEVSSNSVTANVINIRVHRRGSYYSFVPITPFSGFIEFPPTLTQAQLQEIPKVTITKEQAAELIQCAVCLEEFQMNENEIRKLPCNHMYHGTCIFPWLKTNQTCPACREPLPNATANDIDYDIEDVIRQYFLDLVESPSILTTANAETSTEERQTSEEEDSTARTFRHQTPVGTETIRHVPRREAAVHARRAIQRIYR